MNRIFDEYPSEEAWKLLLKEYDAAEFLKDIPFGSPEEERELTAYWINIAAQQFRNYMYFEKEVSRLTKILEEKNE